MARFKVAVLPVALAKRLAKARLVATQGVRSVARSLLAAE